MRRLLKLAGALTMAGAAGAAAPDACAPQDGLGFVCGVTGVEDLAVVGGGRYLVGSSYKLGSAGLYLIDTAQRRAAPVTLTIAAARDPRYAACAPPDLTQLMTHGLDVASDGGTASTVYVVNHGGREAVEVFRLDPRASSAAWIGCVALPPGASGNAVAVLSGGRLAISRFHDAGDEGALGRLLAGERTGVVYIWTPGRGFRTVPGSALAGPNGITASADGHWLFVNDYGGKRIWRLPLGHEGARASVAVPFHPDNLRRAANGSLLVAGQIVRPGRLAELHDWMAVRLDPNTMRVTPLASHRALSVFDSATTAVQAGGRLWFGSFRGDRIAYRLDR